VPRAKLAKLLGESGQAMSCQELITAIRAAL